MKRNKITALFLAAVMAVSVCAVPAFAEGVPADQELSAEEQQELEAAQEIAASPEYQAEALAASSAVATTAKDFVWAGVDNTDDQGTLTANAYKKDLTDKSMADESLDTGSYIKKISGYHEMVIKTKKISRTFLGTEYSGYPTAATVTVYDADGTTLKTIEGTVTKTSDSTWDIIVDIPDSAKGMTPVDGTIPGGYANMIQVDMETNLSNTIVGQLISAMASPSFFYCFNVTKTTA